MQATLPTHPQRKPPFLEKSREQIAAFVIVVNAEGKIKEDYS